MSAPSKKYKSIFFDLDHTLWDYETNAKITLQELYLQYELLAKGVHEFNAFHKKFQEVNAALWYHFDRGAITSEVIRRERFKQILEAFDAHEEKLCEDLSHDYLNTCPLKGNLMPHAHETLAYLSQRYSLTIITNGFEEIQQRKLTAGNLHQYFNHIITSQTAGHRKPAREIFDFALTLNKVSANEAMMVGDNLVTDIGGARNAQIDGVFYNPEKLSHEERPFREITSLSELLQIL
ncbi:YjjG family noncanonical pyrimidine nucleotidase [Pseudochryseolinea flava]|uniref:Noncanonical pyrimidine nucleotidase, YjjG family n=1 Tax=Pseudochryseolinea flava TaxID=2059302 RepID=A0A364Y4A3_9BACT|nr:YjjG family noncanonical pyrimidine nucleotidase [Pseudochryseolinea flava]RAW00645.1 noncanonical pyrimidine nucleotidase, YjjG family [Pseudochryseolinea flava]